jgi:hypothetical protein
MRTIRIKDLSVEGPYKVLAFDLADILEALGQRALDTCWTVNSVVDPQRKIDERIMATGPGADDLERLEDTGRRLGGAELLAIARATCQVIWGEFRGFRSDDDPEPWIVVTAFDSSWFDVSTENDDPLQRLRQRFKDVFDVESPDS